MKIKTRHIQAHPVSRLVFWSRLCRLSTLGGVMLLIAAVAVHAIGGFQVTWNRPTAVAAGLWAVGWPLLFLSLLHSMAIRAGRKEQWSRARQLAILGWIACIGWLALESVLAISLYNTVTSAGL